MTFSEEAAELHRLEAVAVSLGMTSAAFECILREVTAAAQVVGASPAEQLGEIRRCIHLAGSGTQFGRILEQKCPEPVGWG